LGCPQHPLERLIIIKATGTGSGVTSIVHSRNPAQRRGASSGSCYSRCPGAIPRLDPDDRQSDEMFKAHDVFVANSQEDVIATPEDGPAVLAVDLAGMNHVLELELVAAEVDAISLQ
jgi:hypothetical protein